MKTLSRAEAKQRGLSRYYTGKPCIKGHVEQRLVSNGRCAKCLSMSTAARIKERYHTDPVFRDACIKRSQDKYEAEGAVWYWNNVQQAAEINKRWIRNNKEKHLISKARWRANNKERLAFLQSNRRSRQLQAMPSWANAEAIQQFYTEAARQTEQTGVQYTVDHIIPLNGNNACGLHVETNLQLLTLSENSAKGNKHE